MKKNLLFAAGVIFLGSCYNDKYDKLYPAPVTTVTCDTSGTIKYATDIQPIINASCAIVGGCHKSDGNAVTGNLDFTVFSVMQSQSTADILLNDIYFTPSRGHHNMPLNLPQLTACEQKKITRWVNEGAPNN